jgi:hypothetical protein
MVTKKSSKTFLLGWLLLAASLVSFSQHASTPTHPVKGHGCMHPGNVSDCMVVNDYKAHRQYNVFFLSERPAMDTGISFEGLGYSHPDPHCKQGQKVQVTEWKPVSGECPQAQK